MPEHAKGKPLEVWFQDEARVGQQGTLTRKWARRGTRPRAPRDTRYKWSYIFGAACPARGTAAAHAGRAHHEVEVAVAIQIDRRRTCRPSMVDAVIRVDR